VNVVTWQLPNEIPIAGTGIETPTLLQAFEGLKRGNEVLGSVIGSLEILHRILESDDPAELLNIVAGIFQIGATFAPPGLDHMYDFYHDQVLAVIDGIEAINDAKLLSYISTLNAAAQGGTGINESNVFDAVAPLTGSDSIPFSKEWLKAKSAYLDTLL